MIIIHLCPTLSAIFPSPHAQLRKEPNSNQFDDGDDEVFIDVHISQQIKQLPLDILPHQIFIRRGEEARADDVGHRFDNGLGTLALNLDDFVAGGRSAARSEDIVGEEGASGGLQDGRQPVLCGEQSLVDIERHQPAVTQVSCPILAVVTLSSRGRRRSGDS